MSVSLAERRMMEALVAELHRAMTELSDCREQPRDHVEDCEERRPEPRRLAGSWRPRLVPAAER